MPVGAYSKMTDYAARCALRSKGVYLLGSLRCVFIDPHKRRSGTSANGKRHTSKRLCTKSSVDRSCALSAARASTPESRQAILVDQVAPGQVSCLMLTTAALEGHPKLPSHKRQEIEIATLPIGFRRRHVYKHFVLGTRGTWYPGRIFIR